MAFPSEIAEIDLLGNQVNCLTYCLYFRIEAMVRVLRRRGGIGDAAMIQLKIAGVLFHAVFF